jgi:DNA primase
VNSPESELFRKGSIVYGLDRARASITKQDRALVVEGYTDVLALHQAGLEATVASMGTALTEPQLKELRRLTGHLFLCFDADAAGEAATIRGMELAVRAGFDVRIVPLPAGKDPADAVDGFEELLAASVSYLRHRVDSELSEHSKQEANERIDALIKAAPDGPEKEEVARYASDRLGIPLKIAGASATVVGEASRKILGAGDRLERDFLAICAARPDLAERYLGGLDDRHFDNPLHRRFRAYLAGEGEADEELVGLRAELDATVAEEGLDEDVARELVLRLEERLVRRELADLSGEDLDRTVELQGVLARIRDALDRVESELR